MSCNIFIAFIPCVGAFERRKWLIELWLQTVRTNDRKKREKDNDTLPSQVFILATMMSRNLSRDPVPQVLGIVGLDINCSRALKTTNRSFASMRGGE